MDRKQEYLEYWKKWIGNHQADKKALDAYVGNPIEVDIDICSACGEHTGFTEDGSECCGASPIDTDPDIDMER